MEFQDYKEKIIIIDFGSQVTKLIARRVRDLGVFSEIITINELYKIKDLKGIKGIILSGGPSTVTKKKFPKIPKEILLKKIPILGICYGLQLITKLFKGSIKSINLEYMGYSFILKLHIQKMENKYLKIFYF